MIDITKKYPKGAVLITYGGVQVIAGIQNGYFLIRNMARGKPVGIVANLVGDVWKWAYTDTRSKEKKGRDHRPRATFYDVVRQVMQDEYGIQMPVLPDVRSWYGQL